MVARRHPSNRFAWSVPNFAPEAAALRAEVVKQFENPLQVHSRRFVWDWWHVEGQYTALRTPAYAYFQSKAYSRFHRRLVEWGRSVLGCHDISPPWMSCYVTGCEQRLHADVPHGPFAFVFSLTEWAARSFRGGETLLLRDEVLDFAHAFEVQRRVEMGELFHSFEPHFNALTVFDPSIPHGVARVDGVSDPRLGRLVIHGWFVQPRPFLVGPLSPKALEQRLNELQNSVFSKVDCALSGLLSIRFEVTTAGRVARTQVLADTTRVSLPEENARRSVIRRTVEAVKQFSFGKQQKPSVVTVPFVFIQQ